MKVPKRSNYTLSAFLHCTMLQFVGHIVNGPRFKILKGCDFVGYLDEF